MPRPLKELLKEFEWVGWASQPYREDVREMARRLRKLDEFITTARNKSGIWVSATTVRRILDGEEQ